MPLIRVSSPIYQWLSDMKDGMQAGLQREVTFTHVLEALRAEHDAYLEVREP